MVRRVGGGSCCEGAQNLAVEVKKTLTNSLLHALNKMAQPVTTYQKLHEAMEDGATITFDFPIGGAYLGGIPTLSGYDANNNVISSNLEITAPAQKSDNPFPNSPLTFTEGGYDGDPLVQYDYVSFKVGQIVANTAQPPRADIYVAFSSSDSNIYVLYLDPNTNHWIQDGSVSMFTTTLTRSGGSAASSGDPYVCAMLQ